MEGSGQSKGMMGIFCQGWSGAGTFLSTEDYAWPKAFCHFLRWELKTACVSPVHQLYPWLLDEHHSLRTDMGHRYPPFWGCCPDFSTRSIALCKHGLQATWGSSLQKN